MSTGRIQVRKGAASTAAAPAAQVVEDPPGVSPGATLDLEGLISNPGPVAGASLDLSGMGIDAATEQQTSNPPLGLSEDEVRGQLGLLGDGHGGAPLPSSADLEEIKKAVFTVSSTVAYIKQVIDQRLKVVDQRLDDMDKLCVNASPLHAKTMDRFLELEKKIQGIDDSLLKLGENLLNAIDSSFSTLNEAVNDRADEAAAPAAAPKTRAPRKPKDPFTAAEEQKVLDIIQQVPLNTRFPSGQLAGRISGPTGVTVDNVLAIWQKHDLIDTATSEFIRKS